MTSSTKAEAFTLRRRPPLEKLIDNGFRQTTILMAATVAFVLLAIFATVFLGAREGVLPRFVARNCFYIRISVIASKILLMGAP